MKAYDPQVITGVEGSHCLIQLYGWDKDIPINAIREHYGRLGFAIIAENGNGKQFFISWASK